jgi:uncharacterized phage protein (TIGR01671 family)
MREIKFRAWNNSSKEMEYFTSHKMGLQYRCGEFEVSSGWDSYGNPTYNEDNNNKHEIMEYTGLKDKNGKEIYEGDIVRFYFSADTGINGEGATEIIDSVTFENGCFYFMNHKVWKGAYAWRYNEYCEVIGNIHENPELLK